MFTIRLDGLPEEAVAYTVDEMRERLREPSEVAYYAERWLDEVGFKETVRLDDPLLVAEQGILEMMFESICQGYLENMREEIEAESRNDYTCFQVGQAIQLVNERCH